MRLPIQTIHQAIPEAIVAREERHPKAGFLCGIAVENGHLVGTDRGEWGGEITFYSDNLAPKVILKTNTRAIYQTPRGIYAVTGLAHLSGNSGLIYELKRDTSGKWKAESWRALPGAPRFSYLLKDGSLFVNCYSGMVLISPDGEMKALTREEVFGKTPPTK